MSPVVRDMVQLNAEAKAKALRARVSIFKSGSDSSPFCRRVRRRTTPQLRIELRQRGPERTLPHAGGSAQHDQAP